MPANYVDNNDYLNNLYINTSNDALKYLDEAQIACFAKLLDEVDMYVLALICKNAEYIVGNKGITSAQFTQYIRNKQLDYSDRLIYTALGRLELCFAIEQRPRKRTRLYRLDRNGLFMHELLSAAESEYVEILEMVNRLDLE